MHGAHLAEWQPSHVREPVLWLSRHSLFQPNKPIRGGVPICFPWFGAHPTNARAAAHGFARLRDWTLVHADESADGTVTLTLSLSGDETMSADWPHRFRATHRIAIGSRLTMSLKIEHLQPSSRPFRFEAALHTYFAVEEVGRVAITGLNDAEYLDKVERFARKRQGPGPIAFAAETDRVYQANTAACVIDDPGYGRRIIVGKSGSNSTVIWNPWIAKARAMADFGDHEWREMVCVETANVGSDAIHLEAGRAHTMTAEISVERA